MKTWIKDIYKMVLKEKITMDDIGVFPNEDDNESFSIQMGDWWDSPMVDPRYMHVQDYIRSLNDHT